MHRLFLWLTVASAALAQDTGLVEGRLTSSATHRGIPDARVWLTSLITKTEYSAGTDDTGSFRVENLPRGEYTARFQTQGFMDLMPNHPARRVITVVPGSDPVRLNVEFVPPGRLTGRVLDPAGKPLPAARVQFFHANAGIGYNTGTGKNGEFEVRSLIPGKYTLVATFAGPVPSGDAEPKAWAPTWFPNSLDRKDAELILLRGGVELSGYEIRMRAVPVHKVHGQVLDPAGKPLADVKVKAMANDNLSPEFQAATSIEGEFEMALRAGTWFLVAETEAEGKSYGVTTVAVSRSVVEGVKIRLQRRFALAGRIEGPPDAIAVSFVPAGWTIGQVPAAKIAPDGRILAENFIPGRYRVMVRGQIPRTKYLDSIQVGELNAMGIDVDLYPGAPPLRIVFRSDPGSVRGTVERCEAARVVLIPQEETLRSEALMRGAVCDSSGRYDVAGLRPGDYYAFAFDHIGYPMGLLDRTLVNALLPFAARAQVRKGEATSLDLKVTPWPE